MPAGLIEHQDSMFIDGDGGRKLVEVDLHGQGRDFRHHQRKGVVGAGLNGGEDVGEGIALVGAPWRTLSPRVPAMADAPLLADARLVLEHEADAFAWMCIGNRLQPIAEPP